MVGSSPTSIYRRQPQKSPAGKGNGERRVTPQATNSHVAKRATVRRRWQQRRRRRHCQRARRERITARSQAELSKRVEGLRTLWRPLRAAAHQALLTSAWLAAGRSDRLVDAVCMRAVQRAGNTARTAAAPAAAPGAAGCGWMAGRCCGNTRGWSSAMDHLCLRLCGTCYSAGTDASKHGGWPEERCGEVVQTSPTTAPQAAAHPSSHL